jgi:phosphoribosylanthranilate isomerase
MRDSDNIRSVLAIQPNYMGFIFYEKSARYVGEDLDAELLQSFPATVKKVGVFVNAHYNLILQTVKKYSLDMVQLHGNEMPDICRVLRSRGVTVIKAFSIDDNFSFARLNNYKYACDYFLFDTKTDLYGGSGKSFNWEILKKYDNEIPFFLSGGIGPRHVEMLRDLKDLNIQAVDVNSKFELAPGMKDADKLRQFAEDLRQAVNFTIS